MFSMSYDQKHFCHGRGRGFEPRRPRQILKDLHESDGNLKGTEKALNEYSVDISPPAT